MEFRKKRNNIFEYVVPWNLKVVSCSRYDVLRAMLSYLSKFQVPNRFIRISPNGRISYSQRLTVKARCQMDLRKFPLDSQICPLEIGSFGHDASQMVYRYVDHYSC